MQSLSSEPCLPTDTIAQNHACVLSRPLACLRRTDLMRLALQPCESINVSRPHLRTSPRARPLLLSALLLAGATRSPPRISHEAGGADHARRRVALFVLRHPKPPRDSDSPRRPPARFVRSHLRIFWVALRCTADVRRRASSDALLAVTRAGPAVLVIVARHTD